MIFNGTDHHVAPLLPFSFAFLWVHLWSKEKERSGDNRRGIFFKWTVLFRRAPSVKTELNYKRLFSDCLDSCAIVGRILFLFIQNFRDCSFETTYESELKRFLSRRSPAINHDFLSRLLQLLQMQMQMQMQL